MENKQIGGLIAAVGIVLGALAVSPAFAKHDSNTLHKLGKAIQYPFRKDTENLSVDIHRGEKKNSVESERPQKRTVLVTPAGNQYLLHGRYYAHRRWSTRHHRYYYTNH